MFIWEMKVIAEFDRLGMGGCWHTCLGKYFPKLYTSPSVCWLVVYGDIAEQVGHGLPVVNASDGLGQDHTDIHCLDLRTLQFLHLMRDSVGHHHLKYHKDIPNIWSCYII